MTVNNKSIWAHCLNILGNEVPEKPFNTWIRPIQPIEQNNSLKLLAPNEFVVQRLKDHYLKRISELVSDINQQTEILLEVGSRDSIITTPTKTYKSPAASEPLPTIKSRLNPGFTFDGSNLAIPGYLTISGNQIVSPSNFTIDVGGDITLDADGGDILLKDGGTQWGSIFTGGGGTDLYIESALSDKDIIFTPI